MAWWRLSDARFHELKRQIAALEEDLSALEAAHKSLRGRFYATRGGDSAPSPDLPTTVTTTRAEKDAILRDFLAGRRKHQ